MLTPHEMTVREVMAGGRHYPVRVCKGSDGGPASRERGRPRKNQDGGPRLCGMVRRPASLLQAFVLRPGLPLRSLVRQFRQRQQTPFALSDGCDRLVGILQQTDANLTAG